jgi:hypothetical protein
MNTNDWRVEIDRQIDRRKERLEKVIIINK